MFPGFFDEKLVHSSEIKVETAALMDSVLGSLEDEIRKALEYNPPDGLTKKDVATTAHALTLEFLGGTVGEVTLDVAEVPKFNAGERVLLFVEGNGIQFCPVVGVFHGKFRVHKDETSGRDIVLMHDGKPLRDVGEIGTSAGTVI